MVGLFAMIGVIYTARSSKKEREYLLSAKLENIASQIKTLEKKQDKHNSVIERTLILEQNVGTLQTDMQEIHTELKEAQAGISNLNQEIFDIKANEIRLEEKVAK